MSKERQILFSDGTKGTEGDFPIGITYYQKWESPDGVEGGNNLVVDPVFDHGVTSNLYGRIMTLVEATTERDRLKAVKDVFSKELTAWENDVYRSARDIANDNTDPNNLYLK